MTALPARNEQVFRARHREAIACRLSTTRFGRAAFRSLGVAGHFAVKSIRPVRGNVADAFGRAIRA
jgi:hypothetical protein